jgi:hypothetical protein
VTLFAGQPDILRIRLIVEILKLGIFERADDKFKKL